ncbi:MAG: hypothetical protein QJR03_11765 [Sphaerobacter sp.]|nr:hypothetical protein [Sphaerobacter sp.]
MVQRVIIVVLVALALAACGDSRATSTPATTSEAVAAVDPRPTPTVAPSPTPEPTPTPAPTPTPSPTPAPTATPTPTPAPTPTLTREQEMALYRPDVDVRELYKNVMKYYDWKLYYEGEVLSIFSNSDGTLLQLKVWYGAGFLDYEVIIVTYDAAVDTTGIYEDSRVAIWGRPLMMFTITNAYGGKVDQPLLAGDYLQPLD